MILELPESPVNRLLQKRKRRMPLWAGDIIAHFESEIAVVEHEVYYAGVLRHILAEGEECSASAPFAAISCSEEQYRSYLQSEVARHITIAVTPDELSLIEDRRKDQSREDFVLAMFQAGIKTENNT